VLCTGLPQAFGMVRVVLNQMGVRAVAVPRISHPAIADVLVGKPRTTWIEVEDGSMRLGRTRLTEDDAILVSAVHQYPRGAELPEEVAATLLDSGALIVENDINADLCHSGRGPQCLQGRAPDRVVHIGSFSRALAPGLRLGWIAAPTAIGRATARLVARSGLAPSVVEQATLADFISSGGLDRHLRHLRSAYRRRAGALRHEFERRRPDLSVTIPSSGFHAVVDLQQGAEEEAVVSSLAHRGIRVVGMQQSVLHGPPTAPGIVFGYATVSPGTVPDVVAELIAGIDAA